MGGERLRLLERASAECGRLGALADFVPDQGLFLYPYIRREAVLSSQIEGTQSSLADLMLYEIDEAPGVAIEDVTEVSSYVAALELGMERLAQGSPITNRLIREIHGRLLAHGRGADRLPGEFRMSQNWIGGTRPGNAHYVPPPPVLVTDCMSALEAFMNTPQALPALVVAALAHVQFETIHPFLDGNGRVGRLLISLVLADQGVLPRPLLYLSLYFKENRSEYYRLLDQVRTKGDWEAWLEYFLHGVATTASVASNTAHRLRQVILEDEARVRASAKGTATTARALGLLQSPPITTVADLARRLECRFPTASAALNHLMELGIVRERTGRRRGRVFVYERYLDLLSEGTEPLR